MKCLWIIHFYFNVNVLFHTGSRVSNAVVVWELSWMLEEVKFNIIFNHFTCPFCLFIILTILCLCHISYGFGIDCVTDPVAGPSEPLTESSCAEAENLVQEDGGEKEEDDPKQEESNGTSVKAPQISLPPCKLISAICLSVICLWWGFLVSPENKPYVCNIVFFKWSIFLALSRRTHVCISASQQVFCSIWSECFLDVWQLFPAVCSTLCICRRIMTGSSGSQKGRCATGFWTLFPLHIHLTVLPRYSV